MKQIGRNRLENAMKTFVFIFLKYFLQFLDVNVLILWKVKYFTDIKRKKCQKIKFFKIFQNVWKKFLS